MKNLLFGISGTLVALVCAYIIWMLFYFVAPYYMAINSWMILLTLSSIALMIIGGLASIISIPCTYFAYKTNMFFKVIMVLVVALFSYSCVMLPWGLDMTYRFIKVILAISFDSMVLFTMCPLAVFILKGKRDDAETL